MKKVMTILFLALCTVGTSHAQFGKLKKKVNKTTKKATVSDNVANQGVHGQPPLSEIWNPEVEPIMNADEITEEYLYKVKNIYDWLDSGRLSNDERRHIANLFKRIGLIAKRTLEGMRLGTVGDHCEFQVKDMEVIRYEAINKGERPSVDGDPSHVQGFASSWYCPDDVYNTPLHEELRKWFKATEAIVAYDLTKRKQAKYAFIDAGREGKGNVIMCYDKNGDLVRCKNM